MYYVDTSVLFVYTLSKTKEKERYKHVLNFFNNVNSGKYKACVSFYALHEISMIAFQNTPNFELGSEFTKKSSI